MWDRNMGEKCKTTKPTSSELIAFWAWVLVSRSRSTYFRLLALVHKPVGYLAYVSNKLWITSKASFDLMYGDS